jgi:hypothetical protein
LVSVQKLLPIIVLCRCFLFRKPLRLSLYAIVGYALVKQVYVLLLLLNIYQALPSNNSLFPMHFTKIITRLAIIAICCFGSSNKSNAQLVGPSLPDVFWYADTGYIAGINSAMIEFNDTFRNTGVRNWLAVEAYYGNNLEGGIAFTDINSGVTYHWNYGTPGLPYSTYVFGTPDIIVGNSATNPMAEYKVAAAYTEVVSGGPTLWVRYIIDYFTVSYIASGVFTVTHTGNTVFPSSPTMTPYTIHLDVIAEAGNTAATGYPWCDKFVVTWDDLFDGSIYAWQGSLNSTPPASLWNTAPGVQTIAVPAPTPLYRPDVAGIQRRACPTCPIQDFALVT